MADIDKHYLGLQFREKIYKKNGSEFQSFFCDIMSKKFSNFERVKAYGNTGDKKNDGFIKTEGVYYQVYSPENPLEKQGAAAKKMKGDFNGLIEYWQNKYPIKKFYFVFNDKYFGLAPEMFTASSDLKKKYPNIEFDFMTPEKLEKLFFNLDQDALLQIGFSIDERDSKKILTSYLDILKTELDKGNVNLVSGLIEKMRTLLAETKNDDLQLDFELLECRTLQMCEKIPEAIKKYNELMGQYPTDIRPILFLAEIYLATENFEKNRELLSAAEKINSRHPLLNLEKLIRDYNLQKEIDLDDIDENKFPADKRLKSSFYRIYALCYEQAGKRQKADEFFEKAISTNPERYANYETKLAILDNRRISDTSSELKENFIKYLNFVSDKAEIFGNSTIRAQLTLNFRKLGFAMSENDFLEGNNLLKEIFKQVLRLYFDSMVDHVLSIVLLNLKLPDEDFKKLTVYLESAEKEISDHLAQALVLHFLLSENLLPIGKNYFESIGKKDFIEFIKNIETEKYNEVIEFLKKDIQFMFLFSLTAKSFPQLREKIIEIFPKNENFPKNKLLLVNYHEQGDINNAYKVLNEIDISRTLYPECSLYYEIADKKKDYPLKATILERWIELERDTAKKIDYKLYLLEAYLHLKRYPDVIEIGKDLVGMEDKKIKKNNEFILSSTLESYINRGAYIEAAKFIAEHSEKFNTFRLKVFESEVYIRNKQGQKAQKAILEGISFLQRITDEDYASLGYYAIRIDNLNKINLKSKKSIGSNCFVKIKGEDKWYYVGEEKNLDATKISSSDSKYSCFLGKKIGVRVEFPEDKYKSGKEEREIETIYDREDYIFSQIFKNFNNLAREGRLPGVQSVEVPQKEESVDISNLIKFLEDQKKNSDKFFNLYCGQNIPLALLATSEGGLLNAIGKIATEQQGFIRCVGGTPQDIENQRVCAEKALAGTDVFLDGTSAILLAEAGLLNKVLKYIPNIKVPHSVISFLLEASEKFEISPGQVGTMGFSKGNIIFNRAQEDQMKRVRNNIQEAIKIIEENRKNIVHVSNNLVSDCLSEKRIAAELRDACILAQKEGVIVLSDDFLYLHLNSKETSKEIPEHFSSFILAKILSEKGKINLEEFLNFFHYLTSYRAYFLPLSVADLKYAVFGNKKILAFEPENIRKFNLKLILSKEYGVDFKIALRVIMQFLMSIIKDDSITQDAAEKIFTELNLEFFRYHPSSAYISLLACERIVNNKRNVVISPATERKTEKIKLLKKKLAAMPF